jgi:hypothetical protein
MGGVKVLYSNPTTRIFILRGREKPTHGTNQFKSVGLREACFIANFHRVGWRTFLLSHELAEY